MLFTGSARTTGEKVASALLVVLMVISAWVVAMFVYLSAVKAGEDPFSMNRMYAGACIKAINAMERNDIGTAKDDLRRALERGGYECKWEEWGDERYFNCGHPE